MVSSRFRKRKILSGREQTATRSGRLEGSSQKFGVNENGSQDIGWTGRCRYQVTVTIILQGKVCVREVPTRVPNVLSDEVLTPDDRGSHTSRVPPLGLLVAHQVTRRLLDHPPGG